MHHALTQRRNAFLVLAALVAVGGLTIWFTEDGTTFYFDDWEFVISRVGHAPSVFLRPHVDHPSVFPILIYKGLLEVFGLSHYWVFRLVHIGLMELIAVLVYLYGRPRLGPWWALLPAAALVAVGGAPEYLTFTFELTFSCSVAAALGALLAFDARRDRLGSALIVVALFSSGVGITLFPAFIAEVLMRSDRRRRAWVVGLPALLYIAWWIPYHAAGFELSNLPYTVRYVEAMYTTAVGALTTLSNLAVPFAMALALAAVAMVTGPRSRTPRVWFVVLAPLGFWFATAAVRYGHQAPQTERYAYPGAVLLATLIAELGDGRMPRTNRRVLAFAGAATASLLLTNVGLLKVQTENVGEFSGYLRPELTALELTRATASPAFVPDPVRAPDITAKGYFGALDRYGGTASATLSEVQSAIPPVRAAADAVLVAGLDLGPQRLSAPPAGCAPAQADVVLSAGAQLVVDDRKGAGPATVFLRRFADAPGNLIATVPRGTVAGVTVPLGAKAAAYPLRARIEGRGYAACVSSR